MIFLLVCMVINHVHDLSKGNWELSDPFIFNYLGSLCLLYSLVCQVIVRDIVSKVVIAQFRAHKSPISALCFDRSGTLLVTASVQGHNINVFKIMPGSSFSTDAAASYVHLYRLQRGFTNAVRSVLLFSIPSWTCHLLQLVYV